MNIDKYIKLLMNTVTINSYKSKAFCRLTNSPLLRSRHLPSGVSPNEIGPNFVLIKRRTCTSVSYTHLTLPTKRIV